jgi:hypothetical protein
MVGEPHVGGWRVVISKGCQHLRSSECVNKNCQQTQYYSLKPRIFVAVDLVVELAESPLCGGKSCYVGDVNWMAAMLGTTSITLIADNIFNIWTVGWSENLGHVCDSAPLDRFRLPCGRRLRC